MTKSNVICNHIKKEKSFFLFTSSIKRFKSSHKKWGALHKSIKTQRTRYMQAHFGRQVVVGPVLACRSECNASSILTTHY